MGRQRAWAIHLKNFNLEDQVSADELENDLYLRDWTGAEIRNCCRLAYKQRRRVVDAARFVMPLAVNDRKAIEELRREADGKFLPANSDGFYRYRALGGNNELAGQTGERAFDFQH